MATATLVVMAAGMGSRFGGMKQLEPVGKGGEVLLDYSVFDAKRAGFDKIVFIIKKENEKDFREIAGDRIARNIEVEYVFQTIPPFRKKPFGTGEAIMLCKDAVDTPFAIVNADDFYGADAFQKIYDGLSLDTYSMVAYDLFNTLSDNGGVSRGVCAIEDGYLTKITETHELTKDCGLAIDTPVSMNMWGFKPDIFDGLAKGFEEFKKTANIEKDEFAVPSYIGGLLKNGELKVRALRTSAVWFGMTYREDKQDVVDKIAALTAQGVYPEKLWD